MSLPLFIKDIWYKPICSAASHCYLYSVDSDELNLLSYKGTINTNHSNNKIDNEPTNNDSNESNLNRGEKTYITSESHGDAKKLFENTRCTEQSIGTMRLNFQQVEIRDAAITTDITANGMQSFGLFCLPEIQSTIDIMCRAIVDHHSSDVANNGSDDKLHHYMLVNCTTLPSYNSETCINGISTYQLCTNTTVNHYKNNNNKIVIMPFNSLYASSCSYSFLPCSSTHSINADSCEIVYCNVFKNIAKNHVSSISLKYLEYTEKETLFAGNKDHNGSDNEKKIRQNEKIFRIQGDVKKCFKYYALVEKLEAEIESIIDLCATYLHKDRISICQYPLLEYITRVENTLQGENQVKLLKKLFNDQTIKGVLDLLINYRNIYDFLRENEYWQEVKCKIPNVRCYMREEKPAGTTGNKMLRSYTVRYTGVLNVDVLKLLTAMVPELTAKYDYMTELATTLHRYSAFHGIAYFRHNFKIPMLSKRDWLVEYSIDANDDGRISYAMSSIHKPHPHVPPEYEDKRTKHVRANLIKCGGVYEPIKDGICYFNCFVNADIHINLPNWLLRYLTTEMGCRLLEAALYISKNDMEDPKTIYGNFYQKNLQSIQHLYDIIKLSQENRITNPELLHTLNADQYSIDRWSAELSGRQRFPLLTKLPNIAAEF